MTIRADSFSSVNEVTAFTRHLLDGQSAFNSTTRPTVTELEKFIDRASGKINLCLASAGFSPATVYANSTAKLAFDDWVTQEAAKFVELTQRGVGYSETENSRIAAFNTDTPPCQFVEDMTLGLVQLGISQAYQKADGLAFTGLTVQADRADPDDTTLEQPKFKRGQWDSE